jgi:hypothetical protein
MPDKPDPQRPIAGQNEAHPNSDSRRQPRNDERNKLQDKLTPPFGESKTKAPPQG